MDVVGVKARVCLHEALPEKPLLAGFGAGYCQTIITLNAGNGIDFNAQKCCLWMRACRRARELFVRPGGLLSV